MCLPLSVAPCGGGSGVVMCGGAPSAGFAGTSPWRALEGEDFENDDVLAIQGAFGPPPPGRGMTLRTMMSSTYWGLQSAQVPNERKTVEPTSSVSLDRVVRSVSVSERSDEPGADPSIRRLPSPSMPRPDSRPGTMHQPLNPANQCPSAPGPHRRAHTCRPTRTVPPLPQPGGRPPDTPRCPRDAPLSRALSAGRGPHRCARERPPLDPPGPPYRAGLAAGSEDNGGAWRVPRSQRGCRACPPAHRGDDYPEGRVGPVLGSLRSRTERDGCGCSRRS